MKSLKDTMAAVSVGALLTVILLVMVLVLVVGAILPTVTSSLTSYKKNETTFGPILYTLVPILIGAAILIVIVRELIPSGKRGA